MLSLTTASLLLSAATVTQAGFFGWGGFGRTDGLSPLDANSREWRRGVALSNASAIYSLPGRDITKAYPGTPIDGWKLNITAVDLSPIEMGWDLRLLAPASLYTTVDPKTIDNQTESYLAAIADGKIIPNVHESWTVCQFISWGAQSYEEPEKAPKNINTKPDGDCSPWMSDACIKALEKAAASAKRQPATVYKSIPIIPRIACVPPQHVPAECAGVDLDFSPILYKPELPLRYMTGGTTNSNGFEMSTHDKGRQDSGEPPLPANRSQAIWKAMTSDFSAVITVFAKYSGNATNSEEPGFAHLSCIRPEVSGVNSKAGVAKSDGTATHAAHIVSIMMALSLSFFTSF